MKGNVASRDTNNGRKVIVIILMPAIMVSVVIYALLGTIYMIIKRRVHGKQTQ